MRAVVYKNGIKSNGVEVSANSFEEFLDAATRALQLDSPATRLFQINGVEIKDLTGFSEGEFVFASTGEDFISVDSTGLKRSSSSGFEDDEEEVGANLEELDFDAKAIGFDKLPSNYQHYLNSSLEDGEKVLWTDTPTLLQPFIRFLIISMAVLGFGGLMSGLIAEWRVAIFLMLIAAFTVLMIAIVSSSVTHEFYALTTRRIMILHAGVGPKWLWCRQSCKKSPVYTELTNFPIDVEQNFGIGSVFFKSTNLGFKFVSNASEVADMVKKRIPEAPTKALLKF